MPRFDKCDAIVTPQWHSCGGATTCITSNPQAFGVMWPTDHALTSSTTAHVYTPPPGMCMTQACMSMANIHNSCASFSAIPVAFCSIWHPQHKAVLLQAKVPACCPTQPVSHAEAPHPYPQSASLHDLQAENPICPLSAAHPYPYHHHPARSLLKSATCRYFGAALYGAPLVIFEVPSTHPKSPPIHPKLACHHVCRVI